VELGFFIKLTEIPDLASKLTDPEFNEALRTDPARVLADYGIDIPRELIPSPDEIHLPSPDRIAEIKAAFAGLSGDDGDEIIWFPWIFASGTALPWFPGPWFIPIPWFLMQGGSGGEST
jgi:hypothetical protein